MKSLLSLWRLCLPRKAATASSHSTIICCRLHCESLEERALLSASPLWIDADPSVADGILVQIREDMAASWTAEGIGPLSHLTPQLRRIELSDGADIESQLATLRAHPDVLYAEPDYVVQLAAVPNDADFDSLWGLNNLGQTGGTLDADIDAAEAWDITTGSGQTIVAVIDTGVDYLHEDLASNMWTNLGEIPGDGIDNDGNGFIDDIHGYDFANNDGDPMDDHNHGTHVAGTIGAVGNNGIGVAGVNWNVQIMAVKFLQADGGGSISDAIAALDYAVENGATISNNSWGFNGAPSQALQNAVAAAQSLGHIFVAAAGNGNFLGVGLDNDVSPFWPSNIDLDNVVAVAALDDDDQRATFSNFGATTVDVGAPGVGILSTTIGDTYSTFSGTSMATPHVSGALALLWDANPTWSYQQVINQLFNSVDPVNALSGITTTGGRINVFNALADDLTGPQIVSSVPSGEVSTQFDRVRITFSEMIDAASFTTADVISFTGPTGPVAVSDVVPLANSLGRQYDITFLPQNEIGDFVLIIGSEITDISANPLDQDGDGVGGEAVDDRYTHHVTVLPFLARYDFGSAQSAVAQGFTPVFPWTEYTPTAGFGWVGGGGFDVVRAGGDALTSDLNYGTNLKFVADVPSGVYNVTLTIGDLGPYEHDLMDVLFEGITTDTVTTAAGEVKTLQYSNVTVSDGQLTLDLIDQGGVDPNVVLNGLEIVLLGPDVFGPQVTATDPIDEASGPTDRVRLFFNEPIDAASFTIDDVTIAGPSSPIAVTSVAQVAQAEYEIVFDEQTQLGGYQITVGPDVTDVAGNAMDQDGDGVNGEALEDQFTLNFNIVPITQRFDFGTAGSPVAAENMQVTNFTAYSPANGFGYLAGNVQSIDRFVGTAATRDLNYASSFTFVVDGQDGVYEVEISIGDAGPYGHDLMAVYLEGVQVDTVTTLAGEVQTLTYSNIVVSDGQLTLRIEDVGGIDFNVVINALAVTRLGADTSSPRVIAASPSGEVAAPLDRIVVDFSKPIDASTFTPVDVVSLTGPGGPITPSTVNELSATRFEVVFAAQFLVGDYAFELGPDIRDLDGRLMDQDQDAVAGEALEDRFAGSFSIAPVTAKFDFGTPFSPVAVGYDQVLTTTTYSVSLGYGWQSGGLLAVDRGGDPLVGDLVYAQALTFAVDVPDGAYEAILTVGDLGPYAHESMDIFAEGVRIDSISTSAGEIATRTYQGVAVVDGQFTLSMVDAGGFDPNVVLNGLELRAVGAATTRILSADPIVSTSGAVDRVRFVFNSPMNPATFTMADVVELTGPSGPIVPTAVEQVSANEFDVVFDSQHAAGLYSLTIGPDIAATSGGTLDQDGDGAPGEVPDDRFTTTFEVAPFTARFDFGSFGSPTEATYVPVLPWDSYSAEVGYGYESGFVAAVDRFVGSSLQRDIHYGSDLTFGVDAPDGLYSIVLTMGDRGPYAHESMGIFFEGQQIDTVSTAPGEVATFTYNDVAVAGGKFELRLLDLGGPDVNVVLAGLELSAQLTATGAVAATDAAFAAWNDSEGLQPPKSHIANKSNNIQYLSLLSPNPAIAEPASTFQSFRGALGFEPFDEFRFAEWMETVTSLQANHAANLILSVWENESQTINLADAFSAGDDEHREADVAWFERPFMSQHELWGKL